MIWEEENRPSLTRQDSTSACTATAVDSRFSCNICFDAVVEPVVTQCGHLYCWPCLYRWLEPGMYPEERASLGMAFRGYNANILDGSRRVCPVCKSSCSVPMLVPIYVRSSNEPSPVNNATSANSEDQRPCNDDGSTNNHNREERAESLQEENSSMSAQEEHGGDNLQEEANMGSSVENDGVGLRRRPRHEGRQQQHQQEQVPNRPAAVYPQHPIHNNTSSGAIQNQNSSLNDPYRNPHSIGNNNTNGNWITPMSPNGRTHGSLTHGILMSFQQAAIHATDNDAQRRDIPSLHNIRDGSSDQGPSYSEPIDLNAETTAYLSRLLIMLTSFVILCLLLLVD